MIAERTLSIGLRAGAGSVERAAFSRTTPWIRLAGLPRLASITLVAPRGADVKMVALAIELGISGDARDWGDHAGSVDHGPQRCAVVARFALRVLRQERLRIDVDERFTWGAGQVKGDRKGHTRPSARSC